MGSLEAEMTVPVEIAMLIALKKEAMLAEEAQKNADQERERATAIAGAKGILHAMIAERLLGVPDWLRPYDVTEKQWSEDDLENAGRCNSKFPQLKLYFDVPDLTQIAQNVKGDWAAAYPVKEYREAPEIGFFRDTHFRSDLGYVLVSAQENLEEFIKLNSEYQEYLGELRRQVEEDQHLQEIVTLSRQLLCEHKETEEKALFEAFENDPVAIQLLKAFLMIRQERNIFEERISNADDTLCSVEERWSRKAADLRLRADDAERHANEEHERARDLESEKDDIEKRLKKAEGGW